MVITEYEINVRFLLNMCNYSSYRDFFSNLGNKFKYCNLRCSLVKINALKFNVIIGLEESDEPY